MNKKANCSWLCFLLHFFSDSLRHQQVSLWSLLYSSRDKNVSFGAGNGEKNPNHDYECGFATSLPGVSNPELQSPCVFNGKVT